MGPDVFMRAPEIEIAAESLLVHGGSAGVGDVVLIAARITASDPALRIPRGGEHVRVRADEPLRFPLADKAIDHETPGPALTPEEQEAAHLLFRLLGFFKSEGYEGLGSYAEPIDRRASRNRRLGAMLAFAREKGLVTKDGKIYKLHPEAVGLDYLKVRAQVVSDEAVAFLREFVAA